MHANVMLTPGQQLVLDDEKAPKYGGRLSSRYVTFLCEWCDGRLVVGYGRHGERLIVAREEVRIANLSRFAHVSR